MFRSQGAGWWRPAVRASGAGAIAAGAWLGLWLTACQGPEEFYRGDAGGIPIGTGGVAGAIVSGTAGTIGTAGAAGSPVTGVAGTSAGVAGSGPPGRGGSTGAAGSGRGGSTGTAGMPAGDAGAGGPAGRGGSTGAAGSGRGGSTGAAGSGRGGSTGAAGSGRGGSTGAAGSGRGGSTGAAGRGGRGGGTGAAGTTGTGGNNVCPAGGKLDCTAAGSLDLMPDGQVVDFSAAQWNDTTSRWCDAQGLDGSLSSFAGTSSTAMADVDTTARNLVLNLRVAAGGYAGGRINFDSCVDARSFNAIQFSASTSMGSLTGCVWQVQLQTQDQRPTTMTPTGGTCNAAMETCERYPAASLTAATTTATTYNVRFTAFNNPSMSAVATASQIVGVQWQANSSNNGTCTVELRIDNIKFVTQ